MSVINIGELNLACISTIVTCMTNVSMHFSKEESQVIYSKLKECVNELCIMDEKRKVASKALRAVTKEITNENIDNVDSVFDAHLERMAAKKITGDHPYLNEFYNKVSFADLNDSDICITQADCNYLDPISQVQIVNPMRNKLCTHIYERDTILKVLEQKNQFLCPVAACPNRHPIVVSDLALDEELQMKLASLPPPEPMEGILVDD